MAFNLTEVSTDEDRFEVFSLWQRNLPLLKENRISWFYDQNPSGRSFTLLARKDNKDVVGSGSYMVRSIKLGKEEVLISVAVDFSIDEKYRLFGPAVSIQRTLFDLIKNNDALTGGLAFPNKSGQGVVKRVGYKLLGNAEFWSKSLTIRRYLDKKITNGLVSRLLSIVIDSGLKFIDLLTKSRIPSGLYFSEPEKFDSKIDDMWEIGKLEYDITPIRNHVYLNWRYSDNPSDKYYILQLNNQKNEVVGYVIYKEVKDYFEIVDLFSSCSVDIYIYLLQKMISKSREELKSAVCLNFIGNNEFKTALKKAGFRYNKNVTRQLFIMFEDDVFLNPDRWFIFEGDMDL